MHPIHINITPQETLNNLRLDPKPTDDSMQEHHHTIDFPTRNQLKSKKFRNNFRMMMIMKQQEERKNVSSI